MKTKNTNKIEKLQNWLSEFEMIFDENENIRFSEFIGEEMQNKSFEKQLSKTFVIQNHDIQKMLFPLKQKKVMTKTFDDGWLHLEFSKSLFTSDFKTQMEQRFNN
tara:strand:- start:1564 stop:1878 length:315 start_codon:yes stop_codon:yes gene_type:complete